MILFLKTWRDHWKSVLAWGAVLVLMSSIQLSVYPSVVKSSAAMQQFVDAFPAALKKAFRLEDYTSGAGFLSTELFSMIFPLVLIAIGSLWAASATAQEEEDGTGDLLFTLPRSRTQILVAKMVATISVLLFLGAVTVLTIGIGATFVDLSVKTENLIYATLATALLGFVFSGVGFLAGAWLGRKGAALGIAAGLALIAFMIYSLTGLVDTFDSLAFANPFEWALSGSPLFNGADWQGMAGLLVTGTVLYAAALVIFKRRDLAPG